jgi:hypothetical protein
MSLSNGVFDGGMAVAGDLPHPVGTKRPRLSFA